MKLFDYRISNRDPGTSYARSSSRSIATSITVDQFRLFGDGTELALSGNVDLHD